MARTTAMPATEPRPRRQGVELARVASLEGTRRFVWNDATATLGVTRERPAPPEPVDIRDDFGRYRLTEFVIDGRNRGTRSTKGGKTMRIANTELPKVTRFTAPTIDPKVVRAILKDLEGSYDFAPYAFTDEKVYDTASLATSAANVIVNALARETGEDKRLFARKVWEQGGEKDRKKGGKWVFAISRHSTLPAPRQRKATPVAAVAA